jgi:LytS/YehU family sensor histidine kinase
MRARTQHSLQLLVEVEPALQQQPVPGCSVLTLVENAVKFNAGSRALAIRIDAKVAAGKLIIRVADNGLEPSESSGESTGIGLKNLRDRLELLYPQQAHVALARALPHGTTVSLVLPTVAYAVT